jgi:hypothetical protein
LSGQEHEADRPIGSEGGGQDSRESEVVEGGAQRSGERAVADAVT